MSKYLELVDNVLEENREVLEQVDENEMNILLAPQQRKNRRCHQEETDSVS